MKASFLSLFLAACCVSFVHYRASVGSPDPGEPTTREWLRELDERVSAIEPTLAEEVPPLPVLEGMETPLLVVPYCLESPAQKKIRINRKQWGADSRYAERKLQTQD